jgi:cytoskeletal protein CcmA (bactofilin family)
MAKSTEELVSINIIGETTEVQGNIVTSGDMRIDGKLTGDFTSTQKLVVSQNGSVEGNIRCKECDISGNIKGNIIVSELLILRATAFVLGDITVNKLAVEPDAQFSGVCKMNNKQGYHGISKSTVKNEADQTNTPK